MERRKAVQTIALGLAGVTVFSHCRYSPQGLSSFKDEDQRLICALSEIIMPSQSNSFPTPETRLQFILNQVEGGLTLQQTEEYLLGLSSLKRGVKETHSKDFTELDQETQSRIVVKALEAQAELGFFMRKNRQWSMRHFMTSERFMTEYLKYEFIPNRHLGCVPV